MAQLVVSERELKAVFALGAEKRYRYFIKRVVNTETAWSLWDGNAWFIYDSSDGEKYFPVWPAKEYAAACASGRWSKAAPHPIRIDRLIAEFLPAMAADGVPPTIFPTPSDTGIGISPTALRNDIEREIAEYY